MSQTDMLREGLVSVVIPAYRARAYLSEALFSVREQTYGNWEILVVDDCSPEQCVDIVDIFRNLVPDHAVRFIRHETNMRLGGARNTGIFSASGEWVAFLDHDDRWRPRHLELALLALRKTGAAVCYTDFELFHEVPGDYRGNRPPPTDTWGPLPGSLYVHNFIQPSGVVMKTDLARALGGFSTRPAVHMCEDIDFWLRIAGAGFDFVRAEGANLLYRKHAAAATTDIGRILAAKAHVLFNQRDAIREVPWMFRHTRSAIVSAEAARTMRREHPKRAALFYLMAFSAAPWRIKYLAAAAFLLLKSRLYPGGRYS